MLSNTLPNNGNQIFGCVFYINLMSRPDRRKQIQKELERLKLSPNKQCILYASLSDHHNRLTGFQGCTKSHIRALQRGLASKSKFVTIFEDDFYFCMATSKLKKIREFFLD